MRLLSLALFVSLCGALSATTFTVTNLGDTGAGTLRAAITAAEATAGADAIVCASSLTLPGTISLQSALPDITEDLTISGPASNDLIVRRAAAATPFRIFTITAGTVAISGLWLGDGSVVTNAPNGAEGGAILNAGTLMMTDCLLFDCSVTGGNATTGNGSAAQGGAISSSGPLTLLRVAIVNCDAAGGDTADVAASAGGAGGGGIYATGQSIIRQCRVSGCTAVSGSNTGLPSQLSPPVAAGMSLLAAAILQDCDITGCSVADGAGNTDYSSGLFTTGGITLDMRRTSVRGCTGRGIELNGPSTLENCCISGNQSTSTGGVGGFRTNSGAATTLRYCTVTANSGGNVGGISAGGGSPALLGCIVAGNTGANPDVLGSVSDQGFNLVGDDTGSAGFTTSTLVGDALNPINPGLGAIQSFGDTWGHMPNWGSYAIDQGGGAFPIDDQRQANRFFGGTPDIGAVEFIANQSPSFTAGVTVNVQNDGDAVTIAGWATSISPGVSWEAGQVLTFSVTGNTFSFREAPELDPVSGDLTFRPWDGDEGVFTFNVILRDNGGTAGGGSDTSSTSLLTIELEDAGDPDDTIEDDDFECSTGAGSSYGWLALLGLTALLGWRLRRD